MTVVASAPPQSALDAAQVGVARLIAAAAVVGPHSGATYLTAPHQVFHLGLQNAARRAIPELARTGGWRFILTDDSRALAAVFVRAREDGSERYVFSELNSGPFVDSTVEAIRRLEDSHQDFRELRLLDVPALYLMALWLHGDDDRFMPLHPAPTGFEPFRLYSEEEFSRLIASAAASAHPEGPALPPL